MRNFALLISLGLFSSGGPALAQFGPDPDAGTGTGAGAGDAAIKLGKSTTQRMKIGVTIQAVGACRGLYATVPIPTDWPEQSVRVVKEDVTKNVRFVRFRTLGGSVKQMLVLIPQLRPGEKAQALLTIEFTKRNIEAPLKTDGLVIPKSPPRDVRQYLGPSPYINSRHSKFARLAKEITADKDGAWNEVRAIYDWVRENVKYREGKIKSAMDALEDGTGDCEELTSLFIALCRAHDVPARMVWMPGHCYPEFYLEDETGQGHWYPCEAAGNESFGRMISATPILQKGDNFYVAEKRKKVRYVAEFVRGASVRGGKPRVQFHRQFLGQ